MSQLSVLISTIEAAAKAEFVKIEKAAEHFVEEIFGQAVIEVEKLGPIAMQAVLTEAPKLISGAEKFGNAVASVIQEVEGQGAGVALSLAQTAVQAAYTAAQGLLAGK